MLKPEKFSLIGMYAERENFKIMLEEGFTEVSNGGGEWNDIKKIVNMWAFHHPDGRIRTIEQTKRRTSDGLTTMKGPVNKHEFNQTSNFDAYCSDNLVSVGEKTGLKELLEEWED